VEKRGVSPIVGSGWGAVSLVGGWGSVIVGLGMEFLGGGPIVGSGWETRSLVGMGLYRALPKPKKPGFFEPLCLDTDILCKNPVSHQSALCPNPRNRVF